MGASRVSRSASRYLNPKPVTEKFETETRNPKPETQTRDPKLETRNLTPSPPKDPIPATKNPEALSRKPQRRGLPTLRYLKREFFIDNLLV